MNEPKPTSLPLNMRLKPYEPPAHPRAANYMNLGVAQGIASLAVWFLEPAHLTAIAQTAKDGPAAPEGVEGHLVTRVA